MEGADIIIVGAGSAGCVLANRLSADPELKVLVIEAGPPDRDVSLRAPAAMIANLTGTKYNWAFQGTSEPGLDGRAFRHDRGRVLGGSSSINGMCWIRGHAKDYERWRAFGCEGWGWADVLPYFRRSEAYDPGESLFRGGSGPMRVERPRRINPLALAFLKAGQEAGYPSTEDINGQRQEGFGLFDRSIHRGRRWSAARGYLHPVRHRRNLRILTDTQVRRLVLRDGRASGVAIARPDGGELVIDAAREVILCAGAVGSPHLMMLSGIGPGAALRKHGIDVVADCAGVGQNLNDHPDYVLKWHCKRPVSVWPDTRGLRRLWTGLRWVVTGGGSAGTNHFDTVAAVRSRAGLEYPDLQLSLAPIAMDGASWTPVQGHAFQIHVGLMKAKSRGSVSLASPDPSRAPEILVNYLAEPEDVEAMVHGVRLVREIVTQPAFETLRGAAIEPLEGVSSDEDIAARLRACTVSQWHLSCTARMGVEDDPHAVVDAQGRVFGVRGLRVVDASIMPEVVNANTNAPTIMIAEKISDAILGRPPLPPAGPESAVWGIQDWANSQR